MEELDLESSRRRLARIANALGPYRRGVEETLSLTAEHPDMAAARAGKALEAFLVAVHNKRLPSEPRKDLTLEQLQQALAKELRDDVKMHSQVVQRFRNHGAHHREVALRPTDVLPAISALLAIAEWFAAEFPAPAAAPEDGSPVRTEPAQPPTSPPAAMAPSVPSEAPVVPRDSAAAPERKPETREPFLKRLARAVLVVIVMWLLLEAWQQHKLAAQPDRRPAPVLRP
jgi:hypothetical protein